VILPALYWQRRRRARLILDWCDWFGRGGSVEERPSRWVRAVLRPVETFFEERFRVWANGATVINSQLRRRAIGLGVPDSNILDLPNGSDVDTLKPVPRSQARRALGWSGDEIVIGYIGAIFQRDAALMAQAFDRIHQAEPKAQLLLVGCNNVTIENLVAAPDAIRRIGRLDFTEINPYLSACDICWLPLSNSLANRGRYPLKVNDYMAVGRPVVATAVGDVADLIRRGEFGLLASDQPDDLARQVLTLIRDPAQRERRGWRARHLAETEFRWALMGERLERFYQELLANVRNGR
jgi:glycosyltransferase involved in cell wall biosynthesis